MGKYNVNNYSLVELLNFFDIQNDQLTDPNIKSIINSNYKSLQTTISANNDANKSAAIIDFLSKAKQQIFDTINSHEEQLNEDGIMNYVAKVQTQTIEKLWVFDSKHRYIDSFNTDEPNTTDYKYRFSTECRDVKSIELVSINIPCSWYRIDNTSQFNNCFYIDNSLVEISCGTFTIDELKTNFETATQSQNITFSHDNLSRKIKLSSTSINTNSLIKFYDVSDLSFNQNNYRNNLGYILGYRNNIDASGIIDVKWDAINNNYAPACYDLNGFSNLYIWIEDYVNTSSSVLISQTVDTHDNTIADNSNKHYIQSKSVLTTDCSSYVLNDTIVVNGVSYENVNVNLSLPSGNRRSIQQIFADDMKTIQQKVASLKKHTLPAVLNDSQIFATIPVDNYQNNYKNNDSLIYRDDSLRINKREYNGPTHLKNFNIKLLNDEGLPINLNGLDWSFTVRIRQEILRVGESPQ